MAEKRRALFVAPEAPYPLHGGGALRAASLLEYLARCYTVDAIVFHTPGGRVELPSGLVERLDTIELPWHSKTGAARALRNCRRLIGGRPPLIDRFGGFDERIGAILADRRFYDLAVLEHFWCAPYHARIAPRAKRTVLDLHNIESEWHEGCGRVAGWLHAAAHRRFARAAAGLERRFSLLLAASVEDAARAGALAPRASIAVYPNTIPYIEQPSRSEEEVIAFSGTLDYEPNRTAVRYFAESIWPILRERLPKLRWLLIGRNPDAVARYTSGDPRVETTGAVADAIPQLARAKAAVVPLLSGSGTRLKIIEAWAAGTPVVSTLLGAEGLPARHGENILLADGARSFAEAVVGLFASSAERERIAAAGRRAYERELTWNAAWQALDAALARA
jgi:glycosyltransferase involved in cell wall biosynthesis